jgi:hypothetical protein
MVQTGHVDVEGILFGTWKGISFINEIIQCTGKYHCRASFMIDKYTQKICAKMKNMDSMKEPYSSWRGCSCIC